MIPKVSTPILGKLKKSVSLFVLFILAVNSYAQRDLGISGGNNVSSMVCANKQIYVWGQGNSTPTPVAFPGNLNISQVNSGSGGHYVALACDKTVWSWGGNDKGQLGNGICCANVATPTKVKASPTLPAAFRNASNELINADVIYAGNENSFAIMKDGSLLSWGGNTNTGAYGNSNQGQLGNGKVGDQYFADYVVDCAGAPLKGVVQVFAGDNCAYALVDVDGDGIGTVYSWGQGLNGSLGRNAAGTANPKDAATVISNRACPVQYSAPEHIPGDMNNIRAISCSDGTGQALDVDGYVWTWGNGGWNNATGNTTVSYTGSDPRRVLKGSTTGASNDGTYLLAKQIGGGQGYGMAVTVDGKPVAWGGGGCTDGGATGNGTMTGSGATGTGYIKFGPGVNDVHSTVIQINRGDLWGFYQTADNKYYAWGCGANGVLGTGNNTNLPYATNLVPPTACGFRDPIPEVLLTPGDTAVCASSLTGITLKSGFIISAALAPSYKLNWYKDNGLVKTGTAATDINYTATTPGTYKVEVIYIGLNAGCDPYDTARAEMTISTFPVTFTVPTNLTYCGATGTVNVNSTAATKPAYIWYPTAVSTTPMDTTIASGTTIINLAGITAAGNGDKCVWVEEGSYASGSVFKKTQGLDATWSNMEFLNPGAQTNTVESGFTVTEAMTLTSTQIRMSDEMYGAGTHSGTMTFGVYKSKTNNGGLVADDANKIGTFTYSWSRTAAAAGNVFTDATVAINVNLPSAGVYFISLDNSTLVGAGNVKIGKGASNGQVTTLLKDDSNGSLISFTNSSVNGNPQTGGNLNQGNFFNINFQSSQHYCDRKQLCLKQQCPCQQPASVTITAVPTAVAKVVTVCPSSAITLSGTYIAGTTPASVVDAIRFVWYKKGTTPGAYALAPVANKVLTGIPADAGMWYLRVEDGAAGTASCYREDSVTIVFSTVPAPTAMTAKICSGSAFSVTPVNVTNGVVPAGTTYTWSAPTGTGFSGGTAQAVDQTSIGQTLTNTATGISTAVYSVTPKTGTCSGTPFNVTVSVEKDVDAAVAGTATSTCAALFQLGATPVTNGTGTWTSVPSTGITYTTANANSPTATANGLAAATAYTFTWKVSNGAGATCPDKQATVVITRTDITSATPVSTQTKTICSSAAAPLLNTTGVATLKLQETGTWAATGPATINATTGQTAGLVTGANVFTYTITSTIASCTPSVGTVTITVEKEVDASVAGTPDATCATSYQLGATPVTNGVGTWTASPSTGITFTANANTATAVAATLTANTAYTFTWTVSNGAGAKCPDKVSTVLIAQAGDITSATPVSTQTKTICANIAAPLLNTTGVATLKITESAAWSAVSPATITPLGQTGALALGDNVFKYTITSLVPGCAPSIGVVTITVLPLPGPADPIVGLQTVCAGTAGVTYTVPVVSGIGYNWTRPAGSTITAATADSSSITVTFGNTDGTFDFVATPKNSCGTGTPSKLTVTVKKNLTPTVTISGPTEICGGGNATFFVSGSTDGGTAPTYEWYVGLLKQSSTTTSFSTTTLANNDIITVKMTSNEGCVTTAKVTSNAIQVKVVGMVRPKVTLDPKFACKGVAQTITAYPENEGDATAVFEWKLNTVIVQTGTGRTYTSSAFVNGDVLEVQLTSNLSCAGPSKIADTSAVIDVRPVPVATAVDASVCSKVKSVVQMKSNTSGTVFTWTTVAPSGISGSNPAGGNSTPTDSTISENLSTSLLAAGDVVYTITPTAGTCVGAAIQAKATVKPLPSAIATDDLLCDGKTSNIPLTSDVTGATFNWTASGVGVTGQLADNTGTLTNIAQPLINTGTVNGTATYVVTATLAGCSGTAKTVNAVVKPTPVLTPVTPPAICSGAKANITLASNLATATSYGWLGATLSADITGIVSPNTGAKIDDALINSGTADATATYSVVPVSLGCIGIAANINITVKPKPVLTVTSTLATICGGNDPGIDVQSSVSGTTYNWTAVASGAGTATITAPTSGTNVATGALATLLNNTSNAPGIITFTMKPSAAGCTGTDAPIAITVNPSPDAKFISGSLSICSGATTDLKINTSISIPVTFDWTAASTDVTGFSPTGTSTALPTTIAEVLTNAGSANGSVVYTITPSGGGCIGTPLVKTVVVKPIPVATATNNVLELCSGSATSIALSSLTPGATFDVTAAAKFSKASGMHSESALIIGSSIQQTLSSTGTDTVTYTITPTAASCAGLPIKAKVTVYEIPISDAGTAAPYCAGDSAIIGGSSVLGYTYLWSPATDLSATNISMPTTTAKSTTPYTVTTTLTAFPSCSSSANITVAVSPQFTVDALPDFETCANRLTPLTSSPSGLVLYTWTDSIFKTTQDGQNIQIQTENTNTYYLLSSNGGCLARDTVTVSIKDDFKPTLFLPNAFTPNNDGTNEIYRVGAFGVEEFEAMIFNRWGEKIFTWNDVNGGWDGTRNGRLVQEDVYIIAVRVKNICDLEFNDYHRGTITVLR